MKSTIYFFGFILLAAAPTVNGQTVKTELPDVACEKSIESVNLEFAKTRTQNLVRESLSENKQQVEAAIKIDNMLKVFFNEIDLSPLALSKKQEHQVKGISAAVAKAREQTNMVACSYGFDLKGRDAGTVGGCLTQLNMKFAQRLNVKVNHGTNPSFIIRAGIFLNDENFIFEQAVRPHLLVDQRYRLTLREHSAQTAASKNKGSLFEITKLKLQQGLRKTLSADARTKDCSKIKELHTPINVELPTDVLEILDQEINNLIVSRKPLIPPSSLVSVQQPKENEGSN